MRYLIILPYVFLFILKCNSQTLTFKDFYKDININCKVSFLTVENKTKNVSDFNFLKLEPGKGKIDKNDYYKLYYNALDEIVKMERVNKSNQHLNYSIFFNRNKKITEMIIKSRDNESALNLIVINYNKEELFTIKTDTFQSNNGLNNSTNKINSIGEVCLLDSNLNVVNKLIFRNGNLITFSVVKHDKDLRIEKMIIYKDFSDKDNLNSITLRKFMTYLNIGKKYDSAITLTATPFQKKDVPLFFFNSSYR